jgi:hypothetical protein
MNGANRSLKGRALATLLAIAMSLLGVEGSRAWAEEPIVGLWQATIMSGDSVLYNFRTAWTSDGLEMEEFALPILSGPVCYGHWIKLQGRTYGQTHPYYEYKPSGAWAGTSGFINYTVTVSNDGKTLTGKVNSKVGVPGPNPYAAGGTSYSGLTVIATKVEVDKSLLP